MASEVVKDLTDWHQIIPVAGSGGPVKAAEYLANQKAVFEAKSNAAIAAVTAKKIALAQAEVDARNRDVMILGMVGVTVLSVAGILLWRGLGNK